MVLTVVIPTYHPGNYIYECLECLNNQTLSREKFSVMIVLNGSKDPFYDDLQEFLRFKEFKFELLYSDNKGVSNARNFALDKISTGFVTFIDDDDLISPVFLETLLSDAENDAIVVSNFMAFKGKIENPQKDYLTNAYNSLKECKRLTILNGGSKFFSNVCGKLIPISIIGQVRFDSKMSIGEDSVFMVEISKNVHKIKLTHESGIYYRRIRQNSSSAVKIGIIKYSGITFYEIIKYVSFYCHSPFKYNFKFIFSRIISSVKNLFVVALKI